MNQILSQFVVAGLPVLPVNSAKEPMIYSHKFLDSQLPDLDIYKNIEECWVAIKTGNLQTKIECIDFDEKHDPFKDDPEKNKFECFKKICDISDLYLESTITGGYHLLYRTYVVDSSKKLAWCKGIKEAVIETRGVGSYVVVAPSPGYAVISGDIFNLPFIDNDRVEEIKCGCRALNERPEKITKKQPETIYSKTFNKKHCGEVLSQLQSTGWEMVREFPEKIWLRRPGKNKGISGTIFKESGVFYCFTSSTEYNPQCAYSPYQVVMQQKKYTPEQMERETCKEIGENYIKDLIFEILLNSMKLKDFELKKTLYTAVIADMIKKGCFYRTIKNGKRGFYFYNQQLFICDIKDSDFCCLMFVLYGLTNTEGYCKKLYEDIKNYSLSEGAVVEIRNYSYQYDGCVYVDNFDGTIFKITNKDIDMVDNGTDGVLFLKSNNTPISYDPQEINLIDELFGSIVFSSGEISNNEYKGLFLFWIISFYFMSINKPICTFIGEAASGKTFIFKKVLYLLFGNLSGLKVVPEKKENFTAIITNNKFVVFDNADTSRPWLNDALATAATGGCESMRELYLTNKEASYDIDCFIGLTSRTPKFTRDDVADRMILFPVERLKNFPPEEGIIALLLKNRNALMSCIFNQIKLALQNINNPDVVCFSRMGSFENLCRKIKPETEQTFKKLILEQKDFSEDMFTEIFFNYCKNQASDVVIKTPQELAGEMTDIAQKRGLKKMIISSHSIGYKFKKTFDFVDIEKQILKQRQVQYLLKIKCEIEAEKELVKNQIAKEWKD